MTENIDYISIAKTQNQLQEDDAKRQKEQAKNNTMMKNQQVQEQGDIDISNLGGKYRSIYDENAVRQYIGERRVAENMANMGLTDSGLNRTQQTALQVSRGNADYNTRLQYESAVRSIEQSVRDEIAANNMALTNQIATIDQKVASDSAARLYDAEIKQLEYERKQQEEAEKAEREAAEKAEKEAKEAAEKAEKDAKEQAEKEEKAAKEAKDDHDRFVTQLAAALKSSAQTGISAPHVGDILKEYIINHDLTVEDAHFILTSAGIAPQTLAADFFEKAVKERDRWQKIKGKVENYKTATDSGTKYSVVSGFGDALKDYNVSQYGADKLLPLLVRDGYLTQTDVSKIKYFYDSYIGKNPAEKRRIYGDDKILRFAKALHTEGMVSELASQFMEALFYYHNSK